MHKTSSFFFFFLRTETDSSVIGGGGVKRGVVGLKFGAWEGEGKGMFVAGHRGHSQASSSSQVFG